jgi:ubiquinone/menaquinone biosynthesis C-methylase UbiE
MTSRLDANSVSQFYDDNTNLFLSLGQGTEGTIHRAVWGPGVQNRLQAMAFVDSLVMRRLQDQRQDGQGRGNINLGNINLGNVDLNGHAPFRAPRETKRVADLGCGVGASLCRIAKAMPIEGLGVTISETQVAIAQRRIAAQGLATSVRCIQGDFCALPPELEQVDLAFSIEAFVHAPSASDYFRECARLVRRGGLLIVCDDFISEARFRSERPAARWIERFSRGWVAPNVKTEDEASALARAAGFSHVETIDLSAYLEIDRIRDYAAGILMRCFGWLPVKSNYWSMLYGGHALQLAIKRGWIQHLFVVWKRDG